MGSRVLLIKEQEWTRTDTDESSSVFLLIRNIFI